MSFQMSLSDNLSNKSGAQITIKRHVYADYDAKVDYVGFLIPKSHHKSQKDLEGSESTFQLCAWLAGQVKQTLEHLKSRVKASQYVSGQSTSLSALTSLGRVFYLPRGFLIA